MSDNKSYGATGEEPPPAYYPDAETGAYNGQTTLDTTTPPPTYTQSQNEAPPPTYESIVGEIRAAQQSAEGRGDFLKSVCRILLDTTGFTISVCFLFAIPVLMITVGAINLRNCPVEVLIPIWLIVGGSVMSVLQSMSVYQRIKKKCKGNTENEAQPEQPSPAYNMLSGVMGCFNVAWFFAGNVWVYRIYQPNTTDVNEDDYCDHTTYYLSFWLITVVYIIILCFCCCSCWLASCAVGGGSSSNNENQS